MADAPLVSVVIPTRNRRDLLSRALVALARQTYEPCEIIVVDDGSTDDTPTLLAQFAEQNPSLAFRWLRNDPQRGANPSRNRGVGEARGPFVAFLDDDCIAEPEWLKRLLAGFVSDRVAAVTGGVDDAEPANIYELTFKGTHRVHGRGKATRLVGLNMCVRRDLLLKCAFDEDRARPCGEVSVSGRGDEEGLFLTLRALGYEQRVVPNAVVFHEHHYSRRTFFRQAYRGGQAAARLGFKYSLPPRIELTPLLLAYLLIPLGFVGAWWWLVPAACAGFFLAAITYNELVRKRKTILETLMTFPVLLVYYHLRLAGYVVQYARLLCGRDTIERVKLRRAQSMRRAGTRP